MEVRSDRSNETQFLPSSDRVDTAIWMHYMDANKTDREKARRQLHQNEQVQETAPQKAAAITPPTTHHENSQLDEPDTRDTAGNVGTRS